MEAPINHTALIPALPTAYNPLNTHIQRIIYAPTTQQACQAYISRLSDEDEGDWVHLPESFDHSNQWLLNPQRDGSIVLRWGSAA